MEIKAREKIIETMKFMDEESLLHLYDMALTFKSKNQTIPRKKLNLANMQRSQDILSSVKGMLSEDIEREREERC